MVDVKVAAIYRLEGDGAIRAFCDILVSNAVLIKGVRIVEGRNGLFVRMPSRAGKDGKWYESIKPVNKDVRQVLSDTVLKAFNG